MILMKGDMWSAWDEADLFLITTNSTLRQSGHLVMGRGVARQARDRFPGLDLSLGDQIATGCGSGGVYGLLVSPRWPRAKLGAFQVKRHWAHPAELGLIWLSVNSLIRWDMGYPGHTIHLNFPGIGNGGLSADEVMPLIEALPNNVYVWRFP
jgi:hypothetical protein